MSNSEMRHAKWQDLINAESDNGTWELGNWSHTKSGLIQLVFFNPNKTLPEHFDMNREQWEELITFIKRIS